MPLVVDLERNSKPIEQIQVGEMVLARSEFEPQGPLELKRVGELFTRTSPILELEIGGQKIGTTEEHPFYVPAREAFVPARELQVGDQLVSHDGQLLRIDAIHSTLQIATVYNLRVADYHTYFVGGALWGWDVWVHNTYNVPSVAKSILRQIAGDERYLNSRANALHRLVTDPRMAKTNTTATALVEIEPGRYEIWVSANRRRIFNKFKDAVNPPNAAIRERAIAPLTDTEISRLKVLMGDSTRLADAEKNLMILAAIENKKIVGIATQDGRLICPKCQVWTDDFGIELLSGRR